MAKRIIVAVINDLVTDQRVNRECLTLIELGFEVLLVGRVLQDSLPLPKRIYQMKRMKLLFNHGPVFYASFNLRLFFFLIFKQFDIVWSNDLDTLLACRMASRFKRKKIIYDSHEYFTGVPELVNRPKVQKFWKRIEQHIFPKLKLVFTVNDSIAGLYEDEYGLRPLVLRNVPMYNRIVEPRDRKSLGLPEDKTIIIIQGSGINIDRGAEEATEAMQYLENCLLLVIGGGDVIPVLKTMVSRNSLENKVMFLPKMPYSDLLHYTSAADIGLTLDKDTNINYRYSLPNKLFDYIRACTPVLGSALPEVEKVIKNYNIGLIINTHSPKHIALAINEMMKNKETIMQWKANLKIAAGELCWEKEKLIMKEALLQYLK